jgi:hypothetical protein
MAKLNLLSAASSIGSSSLHSPVRWFTHYPVLATLRNPIDQQLVNPVRSVYPISLPDFAYVEAVDVSKFFWGRIFGLPVVGKQAGNENTGRSSVPLDVTQVWASVLPAVAPILLYPRACDIGSMVDIVAILLSAASSSVWFFRLKSSVFPILIVRKTFLDLHREDQVPGPLCSS